MSYVRTFLEYAPPPRYEPDAEPFTKALIEEAEPPDGDWAVIEAIELEPVDSDPAEPASRDFTTENAEFDPGLYRITWEDAAGHTFIGAVTEFPILPAMVPSVREVAAYIRTRTRVPGAKLAGTFNANTEPTAEEVETLISQAVDFVGSTIGGEPCEAELTRDARRAAALYTAILVEVSYFPETTSNGNSSAVRLEALFNARIKTLAAAVAERCGGQGTGEGGGGNDGALPAGHFNDGRVIIGPGSPRTW